jgi:hypothetical protein
VVSPLPRRSGANQLAQNQTQIERRNVNQLPLQNIRVFAQVRSAYAAGVVTMCEAPFDQFAALAQETLPFGALQSLPIAAEFLMPAALIAGQLCEVSLPKLAALKPYWKVSMAALLYRAAALGTISERTKNYLWFRMGQSGYKTKEPVEIPSELPTLLAELIDLHRTGLGYSVTDLARLLVTTEDEVRETFLPRGSGLRLLS